MINSKKPLFFFDKVFFKFIIVGIINTIIGMIIMFTSYNLIGLNYWISSALNYFLTSILSFFLNKYFTFNIKKWSAFIVLGFICNIVFCYFISYFLTKKIV